MTVFRTSRTHPGYGQGQHSITLSDASELSVDPRQIEDRLTLAFESKEYQPPLLPSTALELMQLARRDDVTYPVVAAMLEREPLLATQVLRLAQSPAYRRAEPVRSLEQAAGLLGLRCLADLFLQASLTAKVFRARGYEGPMAALRDHAVATALVARLVCRETSLSDDYAFLCGLLHDVGVAACIIVLADTAAGSAPPPIALALPVIQEIHESMSDRVAQLWQLPPDVRLVIGHHHSLSIGGAIHPVAAAVAVAESIATDLGRRFDVAEDGSRLARAQKALNLGPEQLRAIKRAAEKALGAP